MFYIVSEVNKGFFYLIYLFGQEFIIDLINIVLFEIVKGFLDEFLEVGWFVVGFYIVDCIISGDFFGLCNYDFDVLDFSVYD